jgi:AraC family transcriptional regulator of arabinose operon
MKRTADSMHDPIGPEPRPAWLTPTWLWTDRYRMRMPYRGFRPHGWPPNWHLFLTLAGGGRFQQPGRRLEVGPGDVVLLAPECHHDYGCVPGVGWDFRFAHFLPRPHWHALMALPVVGHGLRHLHLADRKARDGVAAAFRRCHGYRRRFELGAQADALAVNALEEVLLLIAVEQRRQGAGATLSEPIRAVVEHLAARFDQPQSVTGLARLAGLSPSRFAAVFKAQTGDSPIDCLIKLRLREASRHLVQGDEGLAAVAAAVGFSSPYYFSRQFRCAYGLSPGAYRSRCREPQGG